MESPRVALVSLHTSPLDAPGAGDAGGMNVYVAELAHGLKALGWNVEILTRRSNTSDPDHAYTNAGVLVRLLTAGDPAPTVKESLPTITEQFGSAVARLPRFDVYHSHYWLSAAAVLPVARATDAPHILSLHTVAALKNVELAAGQAPEPSERLDAEQRLSRKSHTVIASTRAERDAVIEFYDVAPASVAVIEPGVDVTLFHPSADADERRAELLLVGRIQPLKGQDLAIRALSRIAPAVRPRLMLAGSASGSAVGYLEQLRDLARDRGVDDDVVFLGAVERAEVARRMREASIVLIPSTTETYGLVALEAAASGTPVIAADTAGLRESVADGRTGILIGSRDEAVWARSIGALLGDRERRRTLSIAAARHGAERTWARTALATEGIYRRALDDRRSLRGHPTSQGHG